VPYRDKKVVGVFVRFRAPLHPQMNLEEEFYKLKPEFLKPFFQARQTTTILYLEEIY
jgi:hypothetical protein